MHTSYKSIADAAPVTRDRRYLEGSAGVWYMRPEVFRDFSMGPEWLAERNIALPTVGTLEDTHILLGFVDEQNPDSVWGMMQGEVWSPEGEARELIRRKGLRHTSMSVGDVVQYGKHLYMIDGVGTKRIALRKAVIRLAHSNPSLRPHLLPLLKQA